MPNVKFAERRQEMLRLLSDQTKGDLLSRLCMLTTTVIPCKDAVVVLTTGNSLNGPVASSSENGLKFAKAEFELGEGPTFAVHATGRYQFVSNLSHQLPDSWPILGAKCQEFGIDSIASYPMHVGQTQLGALHALMTADDSISAAGQESALVVVDLMTDALLYLQSGLTEMDFIQLLASTDADRLRVHQATGMVSEMLQCSISDAMAVMRATAFEADVTLADLASQIVNRSLRLEP